ncbi:MAG: DUF805 domain-containing protein [Candidatus Pacebacteria bacterium]|nr:DUF805 domain-containing protein [Candidatus Paceibacterota bacterium]
MPQYVSQHKSQDASLHNSGNSHDHLPEKGLLSFIKTKLESAIKPNDIKQMLLRAGFAEDHIEKAFSYVNKNYKDTHQDLVAANDFMPPLTKDGKSFAGIFSGHTISHSVEQKGLFVGRLRRKDFVLGFLFFFGVGYIIVAFSALILAHFTPNLWQYMLDTIASDPNNYLLMLIPVLLAPITIISLSLIVRRLHNLGLPGGLAFLFLVWFVPSFGQVYPVGFFALDLTLLILFVVLVTIKGNPAPNKYGPLPGSKGSFFKRILNI